MKPELLKQLAHLAIAAQIVVASVLLVLGEASLLICLLTLTLLAVSYYVTDRRGWFVLTQRRADLLALGVMVFSVVAALRTDRQGLLLIVANLQSLLLYVLLFQYKTVRVYWQMALLSVGQMAIASTLAPGPSFGFAMLLHLLFGLLGFGLLLLYSESTRMAGVATAGGQSTAGSAPTETMALWGSATTVEPPSLWRGLVPMALGGVVLTLSIAALIFLALPRWGVSNFESIDTEPIRTVGFSDTVILGELGGAVNNPELVMRVSFYRGRGDRPIQLAGEPLYRGTVVTQYEDRTWSQPTPSHPTLLPTEAGSTITRQRISAEPLDSSEIFHVSPAVAIDEPDQRLKLNSWSDRLFRLEEYRSRTLEFDIGTTGIRGNRQRTVIPCVPRPFDPEKLLAPFDEPEGAELYPRLTELASQILAEREIDPRRNPRAAAQALSDHFHTSGQFFYSLDPQERDPDLDPLEDFVSENRGGHCEYFAGALCLMLRSQGIPSRMVIGFKGGEWNDVGQYYQVQQLHAHTWVEALLEGEQVPQEEFAGEEVPDSAWLTLDPTEGTREGTGATGTGIVDRMWQMVDYGRVIWINYVASLNAKRQREGIYEPLAAGVEAGVENLASVQVWQDRLRAWEQSRPARFWYWYRRHWFSWRGGLVAAGFSLCVVAIFIGGRHAWRLLRERGWLGSKQTADAQPVLEMYRRLEAALVELGVTRQPSQTAREFALVAGGELAEHGEYRRLAPLPARVVNAFYQVRFGGRSLDKSAADAVEHALTELEKSLGRPH